MQQRKRIAIFGSFLANRQSVEYRMAEDLGYLLATHGFSLMCGGHGGIAEALVTGAMRGDGEVMGISLSEAHYQQRQAPITPRIVETVQAATVADRLACFAQADGFVFFSGGIGSLAEFAFIWHSLQLEMKFDRPVVLVSRSWKPILTEIRRVQMVRYSDFRYLYLCEEMRDAVAILTGDYAIKYGNAGLRYDKECLLLDLDGTIVVSPEETLMESCEDAGHFFSKSEVIAAIRNAGWPCNAAGDEMPHVQVLKQLGVDGASALRIAEQLSGDARQLPEIYPDAPETVQKCRERGLTVGIITTRPSTQLAELLSTPPLAGLFDFVVTAGHAGGMADGGLIRRALEVSGISREEILYVGDSFGKHHADPRAIGVDSILLDRHLNQIHDEAAVTIRSLRELEYLVGHRAAQSGAK